MKPNRSSLKEIKVFYDTQLLQQDAIISAKERYCTIKESLEESLKEMKEMREGKLEKRSWRELFKDS